jgi:DNA-binding NtrC family response regulator
MTTPAHTPRALLLVADEVGIRRTLPRSLNGEFDDIHTAGTAAEADEILSSHTVTHVVCDLYLGNGQPLGDELIRTWRRRWPAIQYAALFTGSTYEKDHTYEKVDHIFTKPHGYDDLIGLLRRRIV